MKRIKTTIRFLVIALGVGISIISFSETANAQTSKNQAEQEQEVDENDKKERIGRADKKSVKITLEAARTAALNRVKGEIVEEDFEKENGRLQYAFDVRDGSGKIWDVEVDAITGEILKADDDSDDADADVERISPADAKAVIVSVDAARALALKRVSGSVIEEDLEMENGRMQYAFDIRDGSGKIWDVEVDAITGQILMATDEDDEDANGQQSKVKIVKKSFRHVARALKGVTTKTIGRFF